MPKTHTYQHDDNASLRELRPNPHVLLPGDTVVIPEPKAEAKTKQAGISTGQTHKFQVKVRKIFLRLDVLEGLEGGGGTQALYELAVEGLPEPLQGEIGADGKLDARIPANARRARLTLKDPETKDIIDVIELWLGYLDPVNTLSGVRQRLRRLGFACSSGNGAMDPLTESALRAFQRRYRLEEDGTAGKPTQDKLEALVGL